MNLYAYRITTLNVFTRAIQLGLFLWLGNRFGAGELSDAVFLLQAPLIVLMTVTASTAEIIVMPALHRAERVGWALPLKELIQRRAVVFVAPISIVCLAVGAWFSSYGNPYVLCLLAAMPTLAALSAISSGILNARGHHLRAVLGPAYGSLLGGIVLLLAPVSAVTLASVLFGFELGRFLGLHLHSRHLYRREHKAERIPQGLRTWSVRGSVLQMSASLLGALNPLVDILFANQLADGSVTQIEYAGRLWNVVPLLFAGHLTLLHAEFSRSASNGNLVLGCVHRTAQRIGTMAFLSCLLALAACPWAIEMLYGYGNMDAVMRSTLSKLLMAYLSGAWAFVVGLVYVRALTVQGHIDSITWVAGISVVANIMLNTLLIPFAGIYGIGLATSITYGLNAALLVWFFTRRVLKHK